jgi:capsular polysaccharide transport system permease protein
MRSRVNLVLFLLIFVLPLLLVTSYELSLATNRYGSDSIIGISTPNGNSSALNLSALGLPTQANNQDALTLLEFINSNDMMQYLDRQLHIREHYSEPSVDWWTRLPAGYSDEDFLKYLGSYMTVYYDTNSQLLHLHVEAFNREYAQKVMSTILARSQLFVDKLNQAMIRDQTQFFENQLAESDRRLREAKSAVLQFQRENKLMTTDAEAQLVGSNISTLETQILAKQGQLDAGLKVMNPNSPVLESLRTQIEAMQGQLKQEKNRLAGQQSNAVSELDAKFRELQFNVQFLTTLYQANMTQLETQRADATQRLKYLIVVTQPSIADASQYPDRPWVIGTAAMVLLMIFFVVSLLVAIIREHS